MDVLNYIFIVLYIFEVVFKMSAQGNEDILFIFL